MNPTSAKNRKRRRTAKNLRKRAEYWAKRVPLKGKARPYYEAFDLRFERRNGETGVRYKIRPTEHYRRLLCQLIEMTKGIAVELPAELFQKQEPA